MTLRLRLRLRAALALFVFSGSLSLPLLSFGHFTLDDDRACGSVVLTASHPGVQFEPVRPTLPAEHCALCHWLRAVGGSRTTTAVTVRAWFEPMSTTPEAASIWRAALVVTERPSRAPPPSIG